MTETDLPDIERTGGSILLPVIVVLLLVASAATAMTLQARTSLREAATRRDRLQLGLFADAMVRSAALELRSSLDARSEPLFALDGTPQACALPDGGRLVIAVQDEGGLVDLNKGPQDLILLLLQRAGLSGWDAKASADAIVSRRNPGVAPARPTSRPRGNDPPGRSGFASIDEIEGVPGMTDAAFQRLQTSFTVASGSPGVDPALAAAGLRALVPMKELAGPSLSAAIAPSSHTAFTITATAVSRTGTRVQRRAVLQNDPGGTNAGRFTSWDAPIGFDPLEGIPPGIFCAAVLAALTAT